MHQDRDTGQHTPDESTPVVGISSQLPDKSNFQPLVIDKPVTRDSLIEQHDLNPNDPEVSSLLDRILDLRDRAKVTEHLPAIAANHIEKFKIARRNGMSPQQEPQNP